MSSRWEVFEKFRPKFRKRGIFIRVLPRFGQPRFRPDKVGANSDSGGISTGTQVCFREIRARLEAAA